MTLYGIATDYDYGASHGREYINIWSGGFMGTWEGQAYPTRGAKQITITTYNQDKVIVKLPDGVTFPRTAENYEAIDAAINEALDEYERARGSVQLVAS